MRLIPWMIRAQIVLWLQDRVLGAQDRYERHMRFVAKLAEEGKYEIACAAAQEQYRYSSRIQREKARLHVWRTRLGIPVA